MADEKWIPLKPKDIPPWVEEQYRLFLKDVEGRDWSSYDGAPVAHEERLAFFARLVYHPEAKSFWNAIGARRELLESLWKKDSEDMPAPNHVEHMLEMAFSLYRGPSSLDKQTASKRKAAGKRIAKQAANLHSTLIELRELVEAEHSVPRELAFALAPETLDFLKTIEGNGAAWSATEPTVPRPNVPEPEIRFFVRGVAAYFRHFYNQALLGPTAALASAVYDKPIEPERVWDLLRQPMPGDKSSKNDD